MLCIYKAHRVMRLRPVSVPAVSVSHPVLCHLGEPSLRNAAGKETSLFSSLSIVCNAGAVECFCVPIPCDRLNVPGRHGVRKALWAGAPVCLGC